MAGRRTVVSGEGSGSRSRSAVATPPAPHLSRESDLQAIRLQLEQQRQTLVDEAGVAVIQEANMPPFPDVSDQATAETDQRFAMRIRERERNLIKKIDEALARMDARIYGLCESCGEDIPIPRLQARPVTTLCIECKTSQEARELKR